VVWRKELRADSGGAGEFRGGLGVTVEIGPRHAAPYLLLAMFERVENVAQGRAGGGVGAAGRVYLGSGAALRGKGLQRIPPDHRLILDTPGGGGYGDPRKRARQDVRNDIALGFLSAARAASDHGEVS
jgi:N-methylhydantoinase B